MMRVTTPNSTTWDAFVSQQPRAHVLQLSAWGDLKQAYGWQCQRIALTDDSGTLQAGAQILFRPLPAKLGTLAYIPYGAYVTENAQWPHLWEAIDSCAKDNGAAFLKWEPGYYVQDAPDIAQMGFQRSPQTIQPPATIFIPLDDDDTIQKRMNQSTRRNIRKAYKNDITYYEASADDVSKFTRIMDITGDRNDFGVHEADYYDTAYELFAPDYAALILADHDGDTLAANFVFAAGDTAYYLYGASSSKKRKLMASYGVQWEAMQWARERGCRYYDMWGIPDEDEATLEDEFRERSDGLWGVYRFKRGYGGDVMHSAGAWDRVYNTMVYMGYKAALKVRG